MKLCQVAVVLHVLYGLLHFIRAQTVREAAEGGNITVGCQFYLSGHTKLFCKNNCDKEENVLVETSENYQCKGRYCIKYEDKGTWSRDIMYVSISSVTSADSGLYQCLLKRLTINGKQEFRINVKNNAALNPIYTLKPEPNVTVKPTSDLDLNVQTGDKTSLLPTATTQQSTSSSDHDPQTNASGREWLYVGLSITGVLLLLLAALLLFYWKNKSKVPPVIVDYGSTPATHRVYEEIQDNRVSRPVEMSTLDASASFSETPEDHTSDIYSLATAPGDQHQEEDPSDSVTYTEVDFSNCKNMSINSAPQSQAETVLYSVVHPKNKDPQYATVSLPKH